MEKRQLLVCFPATFDVAEKLDIHRYLDIGIGNNFLNRTQMAQNLRNK
jgi:hypothetical protein